MLTQEQIDFLNRVCRGVWVYTGGGIIVNGEVDMRNEELTKFPISFRRIKGQFYCRQSKLTTLKGMPSVIKASFYCCINQLTSLKGGPKRVRKLYRCHNNKLTNLIGAPVICNANFGCVANQLTSLEGCPKLIKGDLWCRNNPSLSILYGIGRVEGRVYYEHENDLNEWIIQQARSNIFLSHLDIVNWIKNNNKLEFLLKAQQEIRQHFSPRILHLVDMGVYS